MNILVANHHLTQTGGTENYTYAIIVELLRRGHTVEYFTFRKGDISDKIEALGVRFKSKRIYDLIIANHNTTIDFLHKNGYIIQTCHGVTPELEQPSIYADFYVSVSYEVQQYLKSKNIYSLIINNGIDCQRFSPRKELNDNLTSVLSLCQSEEANSFLMNCCEDLNIKLKKINKHTDNLWELELYINEADLIVGIGRSLYDSMACGRAVISYDNRSYSKDLGDGYLNESNIKQSLRYNCSGRGSQKTFTKETFIEELKKYDKSDGHYMRNFALENLNIKLSVNKYLNIQSPVILRVIKIKKLFLLVSKYAISRIKYKI